MLSTDSSGAAWLRGGALIDEPARCVPRHWLRHHKRFAQL
jgi:hypothetical protein